MALSTPSMQRTPESDREIDERSAELVRRFHGGDRDAAFTELYELLYDKIFAYLQSIFRNYDDAEEGTQEVFTLAFEALPEYESQPDVPLRAWLFTIACHYGARQRKLKAREHLLKDPNRIEALYERQLGAAEDVPDLPEAETILNGGLDRALDALIGDATLAICLRKLPLPQRQVLLLWLGLDMATATIAAAMGRKDTWVRQARKRGLATMAQWYAKSEARRSGDMRRAPTLVLRRAQNTLRARRFALAGGPPVF